MRPVRDRAEIFLASVGAATLMALIPLALATTSGAETSPRPLDAGCNMVTLTYSSGTEASTLAAAVSPQGVLNTIWRLDNSTGAFQAFKPDAPQASDLRSVNLLDVVFICVDARATITMYDVAPDPSGATMSTGLGAGCNTVALTFPDGTTPSVIAGAVAPPESFESIWRYNAALDSFQNYVAAAPVASDLDNLRFLDAVFLCLGGPGSITMPALEGMPPATPTPEPVASGLTVHFIDVGHGDATLIEAGDADILVDGGASGSGVSAYLAGQDVPDIDLMVVTHPHPDHFGGLTDVLKRYRVLEVWTSGASSVSPAYQDFEAAVVAEGALVRQVRRGYSAQYGGVTFAVLHPPDQLTGDANGDSIVLGVTCGSVRVLLTGDATSASESSMLMDPSVDLDADVLKVAHHGAGTSTTDAFLDAVTPADAVLSVAAGAPYDEPRQEVLDRLAAHGVTAYRTDVDGTVVLTSDCITYSISTTGAPTPPAATATAPASVPTPVIRSQRE